MVNVGYQELSRSGLMLLIAAMAPVLLVLVASTWIVAGWARGVDPLWPDPKLTVSEAAALVNTGEMTRLIAAEGQDPSRAWPVREGVLGGDSENMTPLEAAIRTRRPDTMSILLRLGAVPPAAGAARRDLICRAVEAGVSSIVETLLKTGDQSDPRIDCPEPSP